jgi:mRNA interferase RelE/StbE
MYTIQYSEKALKELKKMDKYTSLLIVSWIKKHLNNCDNPRLYGKPLEANHSGKWRYRIGQYRVIANIYDK